MTAKQICIETDGSSARADPCILSLLTSWLTADITVFEPGGPLGHQRRRQSVRFFRSDDDGWVWFGAWLVPEVTARLEASGWHVIVTDHWPGNSRPLTAEHLRVGLPSHEQRFLDALLSGPRGIIRVRNTYQMVHAIELICQYFPTCRVYVGAPTQRTVRQVTRNLGRRLGPKVKSMHEWKWDPGDRVHVGTYHLLGHCNPLDWDLVILTDALPAITPAYRDLFSTLSHRRIFSFLRPHAGLGEQRRHHLHLLCGPVIYPLPAPSDRTAPVRVYWTPPWSPPYADLRGLERKRRGYWHDESRNAHLAAVATAFTTGSLESLWEVGLFLNDRQEPLFHGGERLAVAILVESVEHGRELLARLPGWQLLAGLPHAVTDAERAPVAWDDDLHRLDRVILTQVRASSLSVIDTDVLIRAEGSEWALHLPGWPPRPHTSDRPSVLVDLADDFDEVAQQASRSRHQDYRDRRWNTETGPHWLGMALRDPRNPNSRADTSPVTRRG